MTDEAHEQPQSESDLSTDERLSKLEDLVSNLDSTVNDFAERVQDLEETGENHEQQLTVLESRANHLTDGLTDVESETRTLQNNVKRLQSEGASELKARVESQVSTMERVLIWGEDYVGVDESTALNRAKAIGENWEDWSSVTPRGKSISSSSDNLKAMLSATTGEDLQWTQVSRAAEKLASMSAGKIEYVHENGNRKLAASKDVTWVTDEDDLIDRDVVTEEESVTLGPADED